MFNTSVDEMRNFKQGEMKIKPCVSEWVTHINAESSHTKLYYFSRHKTTDNICLFIDDYYLIGEMMKDKTSLSSTQMKAIQALPAYYRNELFFDEKRDFSLESVRRTSLAGGRSRAGSVKRKQSVNDQNGSVAGEGRRRRTLVAGSLPLQEFRSSTERKLESNQGSLTGSNVLHSKTTDDLSQQESKNSVRARRISSVTQSNRMKRQSICPQDSAGMKKEPTEEDLLAKAKGGILKHDDGVTAQEIQTAVENYHKRLSQDNPFQNNEAVGARGDVKAQASFHQKGLSRYSKSIVISILLILAFAIATNIYTYFQVEEYKNRLNKLDDASQRPFHLQRIGVGIRWMWVSKQGRTLPTGIDYTTVKTETLASVNYMSNYNLQVRTENNDVSGTDINVSILQFAKVNGEVSSVTKTLNEAVNDYIGSAQVLLNNDTLLEASTSLNEDVFNIVRNSDIIITQINITTENYQSDLSDFFDNLGVLLYIFLGIGVGLSIALFYISIYRNMTSIKKSKEKVLRVFVDIPRSIREDIQDDLAAKVTAMVANEDEAAALLYSFEMEADSKAEHQVSRKEFENKERRMVLSQKHRKRKVISSNVVLMKLVGFGAFWFAVSVGYWIAYCKYIFNFQCFLSLEEYLNRIIVFVSFSDTQEDLKVNTPTVTWAENRRFSCSKSLFVVNEYIHSTFSDSYYTLKISSSSVSQNNLQYVEQITSEYVNETLAFNSYVENMLTFGDFNTHSQRSKYSPNYFWNPVLNDISREFPNNVYKITFDNACVEGSPSTCSSFDYTIMLSGLHSAINDYLLKGSLVESDTRNSAGSGDINSQMSTAYMSSFSQSQFLYLPFPNEKIRNTYVDEYSNKADQLQLFLIIELAAFVVLSLICYLWIFRKLYSVMSRQIRNIRMMLLYFIPNEVLKKISYSKSLSWFHKPEQGQITDKGVGAVLIPKGLIPKDNSIAYHT